MPTDLKLRLITIEVPIDPEFSDVAAREVERIARRHISDLVDASRELGEPDEVPVRAVRLAAEKLWDPQRLERERRASWVYRFVALPFGVAAGLLYPLTTSPFNWVTLSLFVAALATGAVLVAVGVRIEKGRR